MGVHCRVHGLLGLDVWDWISSSVFSSSPARMSSTRSWCSCVTVSKITPPFSRASRMWEGVSSPWYAASSAGLSATVKGYSWKS